MTVQTETNRMDYVTTAGLFAYPYTFRILDQTHLEVYLAGSLLTLTTHYTVSGVGDAGGGTVTLLSDPGAGAALVILRNVPVTQLADYVENDKFPAETHEAALDKLTMIAQQHAETFDRTFQVAKGSVAGSPVLPTPETGSFLRWAGTTPPTIENADIVTSGAIGIPVSQANGGTGQDTSGKTGQPSLRAGTWYFPQKAICVDEFGADPTGAADSAAAIQAAIDSDIPHLIFAANGVYKLNAAITVDPITNANTYRIGRNIDGNGCRIVGANSIVNAFVLTDSTYPNNHTHTAFHDFVFDGTVSGAFVRANTASHWSNDFYNLRTAPSAAGNALLEFHNTSASSQPGMVRVWNLKTSLKYAVYFAKDGGALGDFDDFLLAWINHGSTVAGSAAIKVDTGCNLIYAHIHDIVSGGVNVIDATSAYVYKSKISRIYAEITDAAAANYLLTGEFDWCDIDTVWFYIANRTDNPGVKILYALGSFNTIRNVGGHCSVDGGPPYGVTSYPVIHLLSGDGNTVEFPRQYLQNGVSMGTSSPMTNTTYLGGPIEKNYNANDTIPSWLCRDLIVTNYGQGADATITLPTAGPGMHLRFCMVGGGGAYHVKAGPNDKFYLDGTALDNGDKVTNAAAAAGEVLEVWSVTFDNGTTWDWIAKSVIGTYTDGGA